MTSAPTSTSSIGDLSNDLQDEVWSIFNLCRDPYQPMRESLDSCASQWQPWDPATGGRTVHHALPGRSDLVALQTAWRSFRSAVESAAAHLASRGKIRSPKVKAYVLRFWVYNHDGWYAAKLAKQRAFRATEEGKRLNAKQRAEWAKRTGDAKRKKRRGDPEYRAKEAAAARRRYAAKKARARSEAEVLESIASSDVTPPKPASRRAEFPAATAAARRASPPPHDEYDLELDDEVTCSDREHEGDQDSFGADSEDDGNEETLGEFEDEPCEELERNEEPPAASPAADPYELDDSFLTMSSEEFLRR